MQYALKLIFKKSVDEQSLIWGQYHFHSNSLITFKKHVMSALYMMVNLFSLVKSCGKILSPKKFQKETILNLAIKLEFS